MTESQIKTKIQSLVRYVDEQKSRLSSKKFTRAGSEEFLKSDISKTLKRIEELKLVTPVAVGKKG